MTPSQAALDRIAAETEVIGHDRFHHHDFGVISRADGGMRDLLRDFLYLHYFAQDVGETATLLDGPPEHPLWMDEDPAFIARIEAANTGVRCLGPEWTVLSAEDDAVVVTAQGCEVTLDRGELGSPVIPAPGDLVDIYFPTFRRYAQRGWYALLGSSGPCSSDSAPFVRTYLSPHEGEGVEQLIAVLTAELNDRRVRFQVKLRNHPASYRRLDAFVLYMAAADWIANRDVLRAAYGAVRSSLEPGTPCFAAELAPGISVAQEPTRDGVGLSYGQQRCRIVAEGLIDAAREGMTTAVQRRSAIENRFASHGLDVARPYRESTTPVDAEVFEKWEVAAKSVV